ncbi:MAG: hypothetical protein AAF234_16910 [Pseudomonadota bacterium]
MLDDKRGWGVEILGPEDEKALWVKVLKAPFPPYLETVSDPLGDYIVLMSLKFDGLSSAGDVQTTAKEMLPLLSVSMRQLHQTKPMRIGASIEFVAGCSPRRHHFIALEASGIVLGGGPIEVVHTDAEGNIIEPDPMPSAAQRWMQVAGASPNIAAGMAYIDGTPGWLEIYKAYEVLKDLPSSTAIGDDVNRLTQTANTMDNRHSPLTKKGGTPHRYPMNLHEAKCLIVRWLDAAVKDALGE